MGRTLFVAGTGSYALEVVEWAGDDGYAVAGLIEVMDDARIGTRIHDLPVVGGDAPRGDGRFVCGMGGARLGYGRELERRGWDAATVIHPTAHVSRSARVAPGCVVAPRSVIGAATVLEEHVLISRGALIGHHTRLGAGVVANPGANIAGNVRIGSGTIIGIGAVIVDHIEVGDDAVVAAGAVVVGAVASGERVQGVPARRFEARA
jgi:sugar O-acyltransferase (sialic acid O-acetyltransferase NeuD family)